MADTYNDFRVFYSWQSDLPDETNRGLIREGLREAKSRLEAEYASKMLRVTIDEATRDVPGSPNIPQTILSKIRAADAFVADISTINANRAPDQRACPNPNVMVELGYAVAHVGWGRIVMLFNKAHGVFPADAPFDIDRQRLSAYDLGLLPDASAMPTKKVRATELEKRKKPLFDLLYHAIKMIIEHRPNRPALEEMTIPDELACYVLYGTALPFAYRASSGGDLSTRLRRRLDLADRWQQSGRRILDVAQPQLSDSMLDLLKRVDANLKWLISEAYAALPAAGEVGRRRDNEHFTAAREEAYYLQEEIESALKKNAAVVALQSSDRKWTILGFANEQAFCEYVIPTVGALARGSNLVVRDLLQRLMELPSWTFAGLHQEGYAKSITMDTLNALDSENWIAWLGDEHGTLTPVGKRLLGTLLVEAESAQQPAAPNGAPSLPPLDTVPRG